eukprot:g2333.t1
MSRKLKGSFEAPLPLSEAERLVVTLRKALWPGRLVKWRIPDAGEAGSKVFWHGGGRPQKALVQGDGLHPATVRIWSEGLVVQSDDLGICIQSFAGSQEKQPQAFIPTTDVDEALAAGDLELLTLQPGCSVMRGQEVGVLHCRRGEYAIVDFLGEIGWEGPLDHLEPAKEDAAASQFLAAIGELFPKCASEAALNPMLGIVVPIGSASIFVKPKERSSEDYYEDESARRSPVRAEADSDEAAPQVVGADFLGEVWQVKAGPAGGWIDFDAQISLEISDAIARGEESFRVTVRGTNYEINVVEPRLMGRSGAAAAVCPRFGRTLHHSV